MNVLCHGGESPLSLVVELKSAHDLIAADSASRGKAASSDPYVTLRQGKIVFFVQQAITI